MSNHSFNARPAWTTHCPKPIKIKNHIKKPTQKSTSINQNKNNNYHHLINHMCGNFRCITTTKNYQPIDWLIVNLYNDNLSPYIAGYEGKRSMPLSPTTPTGGGSLKIGRPRSRSKSPFRSFRWKRGSSRAVDSDDEEGNNFHLFVFFFNKFILFCLFLIKCF